jgi:hypothetical protein
VKECCLLCHKWANGGSLSKVQLQLSSSKITNEFVGKLTRFPVQSVWHGLFTEYVFNNIIISPPFPGKNVKGTEASTVNYCVKNVLKILVGLSYRICHPNDRVVTTNTSFSKLLLEHSLLIFY